ncbi:MAG: hypothetical protein ABT01_01395 [Clostridium sp. SCN 57-10]|nr:MAG: hypothetical protein ABT01_01395 [Clostridium sp. SCN 57-10]
MNHCAGCGRECLHKLCMRKIPVFSSLDREELEHVSATVQHRMYGKGETVAKEGDRLDALYIVRSGSVKAFKLTPDGREQILFVFSEGDFFGERNLFGGRPAPYTVEALEPCGVCLITREHWNDVLRAHPEIAVKIIEELGGRMERMENALQSMGVRNLDGRIGMLLLEFAEKYGSAVPEGTLIRLPLSREGIANYLGVARETVSRKLGQLEDEGVIRSVSGKSILLLDRNALAAAAGKNETDR